MKRKSKLNGNERDRAQILYVNQNSNAQYGVTIEMLTEKLFKKIKRRGKRNEKRKNERKNEKMEGKRTER